MLDQAVGEREIVRLDFHQVEGGCVVARFARRERCFLPLAHETKAAFDLEAALDWCRAAGWTVRRWPGGARAWRYGMEPVRTQAQAERLRKEGVLQIGPDWAEQGFPIDQIDFRTDL